MFEFLFYTFANRRSSGLVGSFIQLTMEDQVNFPDSQLTIEDQVDLSDLLISETEYGFKISLYHNIIFTEQLILC